MFGHGLLVVFAVAVHADTRALLSRRLGDLKCDGDFESLEAGSMCKSTWSKLTKGSHQLLPTEPSVGYAWVFGQMNNHFKSPKQAKKWLGQKGHEFPVVLHGDNLYLTDRHHHALAIQQTHDKDTWDLDITIFVECDLRHLSEDAFWDEMQKRNYNLLINRPRGTPFALPTVVKASSLPSGFTDLGAFTDNLWRSLAGFASHTDDDATRCYLKPCVAFVDYEWSYVLNYAAEVDTSLWPAGSNATAFKGMLEAMTYQPMSPSAVDLDSWAKVAEAALPLCHSPSIEGFKLPSSLPFPNPTLQGWHTTPMPGDTDCTYKACSITTMISV